MQTPANVSSIFPRGVLVWGQIPGLAGRRRTQTQLVGWGVSSASQESSGRWPRLTLTLSFPHRTESEVPPRPASPKVSRSPPEVAAQAEDTARKSELAVEGEWGQRVGKNGGGKSRPSHVFRQPGEARNPGS